jgi:GH15 family glucan-1,4-alpha-glucosidase
VDHRRGIFVESYDSKRVDAALLLLPGTNFVAFDDPRMVRTTAVIQKELSWDGLLLRYKSEDGLRGHEGVFLACTYWLVECLARQGKLRQAHQVFKSANAAGNDLGLFAEQYAPQRREMLGNFPQGLTHLAHIAAALALNPKPSRRRPVTKARRRRNQSRKR